MYRMLIVDDEPDERKVISFLLDKFQYEFDVLEAANGKEALSVMRTHRIDVLITDVKMPYINGIELARRARAFNSDMHIIFFSGFDDFEYAKSALSVQAIDYLLKPVIPDDFHSILSIVQKKLQEEEARSNMQKISGMLQKKYVVIQILKQIPIEKIREYNSDVDLSFLKSYRRLFLLHFDKPFFERIADFEFDDKLITHLHKITDIKIHLVNLDPFQNILFLDKSAAANDTYLRIANYIHEYVKGSWNADCYIAVSHKIEGPEEIYKRYIEAETYLNGRFYDSDRFIYTEAEQSAPEEESPDFDDKILSMIENDIHYKDCESLYKNVDLILNKYSRKSGLSHNYIRFICTNLLHTLYKSVPAGETGALEADITSIFNAGSFDEIRKIISRKLSDVITEFKREQKSTTFAISQILQYISQHYNEEVSLQVLSQVVYLSPRYISSLFIKEIGYGINKYIKNVRMEKAKELLSNTNMKVNSICREVGYSKLSYFCQSFQEEFGVTPVKYRQNIMARGSIGSVKTRENDEEIC